MSAESAKQLIEFHINSCGEHSQLKSCDNLIDNFIKLYKDQKLSGELLKSLNSKKEQLYAKN